MKKYEIIDAHCHIYPEKIAAKAVGATDAFYGASSFGKGTTADLREICEKTRDFNFTDIFLWTI